MTTPFTPRQGGDGQYFHGDDYEGDGRRLNALVFGGIGAAAGYKFYERFKRYGSQAEVLGASLRHGAIMAIRWKAWFVTALWWLITTPVWMSFASGGFDQTIAKLNPRPTELELTMARNMAPHPDDYEYWLEHTAGFYPNTILNSVFHGSKALVWSIFALHIVIGFLAVGVTYNKHIRASGFKQRWFFRAMAPVERLVSGVDWKILNSLVVVPVALAIIAYNQ
jgi:hypothetical protein